MLLHGSLAGHRRRVQEAEAAHAVRARVVSGRTNHGEARAKPAVAHSLGERQDRPGRKARCLGCRGRVVHVTASLGPAVRALTKRSQCCGLLAEPATYLPRRRMLQGIKGVAVLCCVAAQCLLPACLTDWDLNTSRSEASFFELREGQECGIQSPEPGGQQGKQWAPPPAGWEGVGTGVALRANVG